MDIPYFYVDALYGDTTEYQGICIKVGDKIVNREYSDNIKEDARKTGVFADSSGYINWLNSSSIDNYIHDLAEEQGLDYEDYPDYDLRELIQKGYLEAMKNFEMRVKFSQSV